MLDKLHEMVDTIDKEKFNLFEKAEMVMNPSDISSRIRYNFLKEEQNIQERARKRIEEYNGKPNNVVTNESLQVWFNDEQKPVNWNSEKYIDSTIRELLAIKMNLMKESIESLGIEFQETAQYNKQFIKYNNWMMPGMWEGSPSNETIDTAIAILCSISINGDFPIPSHVLEYIKQMLLGGWIYDKRITSVLSSEDLLNKGKLIVQTLVDAGVNNYAAIAIAGSVFFDSNWDLTYLPKENEFTGLISQKKYKVNNKGHNWSDASEGLFGLKLWSEKEKIINDPEFEPIREKYNIPTTFDAYNKDLAGGSSNAYNVSWRGTSFEVSGHLSDLEFSEWCTVLKLSIKKSKFWESVFANSSENEDKVKSIDEDYLTSCLAASYLFKINGNEPTFSEAKARSSIHRNQDAGMGLRVQDEWGTQIVASIVLSRYISGEPVKSYDELKEIIFKM